VPDYIITIHLKIGKPRMGVRWHPSYDLEQVRVLVEKKVYLALGTAIVDKIDVALAPEGFRKGMEAKSLVQ
jgi:hypothetical protein